MPGVVIGLRPGSSKKATRPHAIPSAGGPRTVSSRRRPAPATSQVGGRGGPTHRRSAIMSTEQRKTEQTQTDPTQTEHRRTADFDRWLPVANSRLEPITRLSVPYDVFVAEAVKAARFVERNWEPGPGRPGLGRLKGRVPAETP